MSSAQPSSALRGPLHRQPGQSLDDQPGQSLDEELQRITTEEIDPIAAVIMLVAVMAVIEWIRWFRPFGPQPLVFTALALGTILWGLHRARRIRAVLRNLRIGRDGERMVAQILSPLLADGHQLLHDIPGEGFNLDHVVIGPHGVYVVETKTRTRRGPGSRVAVRDGFIYLDGARESGDSQGQARAAAAWLEGLIGQLIGERIVVQPVVVFPGWYVECEHPYELPVWVCNPKGLCAFIRHARARLPPAMQGRICHALIEHTQMRMHLTRQAAGAR